MSKQALRLGLFILMCVFKGSAGAADSQFEKIQHIVVIYLENRSFDSVFGLFPNAEGLSRIKSANQLDAYGHLYQALPPVMNGKQIDDRFPTNLPNQPFNIGAYVPPDQRHPDLTHRFFINQMQIDGGKNDRFAAYSSAGALSIGHYDLSKTALWGYAQQFTLADHFFQAAFGGSFLNHQWLICACTPQFADAPPAMKEWQFDLNSGKALNDPTVTVDGYAVGTIQPHFGPYDARYGQDDERNRLPAQSQATIGDRLTEKGVSWVWYAGDWDKAEAGKGNDLDVNFQYHHQPFVFYTNYAQGTQARKEHLQDRGQLLDILKQNGELPQVVFYKPASIDDQHPGYSSIIKADEDVKEVVEAIRSSRNWQSTAIIITYDEYGGFWDHVPPPHIDRWGPGTRIPAIIMSPFAKRHFIDHTVYDTTSILKFIESRFGLQPLGSRDQNAVNLLHAFNF